MAQKATRLGAPLGLTAGGEKNCKATIKPLIIKTTKHFRSIIKPYQNTTIYKYKTL